jgi:serine protease Do
VQNGCPAAKAGIKPGDIVVDFNNKSVTSPSELRNEVAGTAPGTKADVKVFRDGAEKELTVKVGELKEQTATLAGAIETADQLGITVENLSPDMAKELGVKREESGVVITAVEPGSVAAEAGLQPHDVIVRVQDQPVKDVAQFHAELERYPLKDGVRLAVQNGTMKRFVFLQAHG